jgi:hypothetical protein
VVEAARVDGKDLRKESESIALEGLEGHWVMGKRQPGNAQREGRGNDGV